MRELHKCTSNCVLGTMKRLTASFSGSFSAKDLTSNDVSFLRNDAKTALRALFTQSTTLAFGCSTPDAELLFVVERVLQTLRANLALRAHRARCFRRTTAFGEEDFGINFVATRVRLPINRLQELVRDALHSPGPLPSFVRRSARRTDSLHHRNHLGGKSHFCNSRRVI